MMLRFKTIDPAEADRLRAAGASRKVTQAGFAAVGGWRRVEGWVELVVPARALSSGEPVWEITMNAVDVPPREGD